MGFIIEGNNIHVEARDESFYIAKSKLKHELLDIVEIDYVDLEELKQLIDDVQENRRYKEWRDAHKKTQKLNEDKSS